MNSHSAAHSQYVFEGSDCYEQVLECLALNRKSVGFLAEREVEAGRAVRHPHLSCPIEVIRGPQARFKISNPDVVKNGIPLSSYAGAPPELLASLLYFFVQTRSALKLRCKELGRELAELPLGPYNLLITKTGPALHRRGLVAVTPAELSSLLRATLHWVRPWRWQTRIFTDREIVETVCSIGRDTFIETNAGHPIGEIFDEPPKDTRALAAALAPWIAPPYKFPAFTQIASVPQVRNDTEREEETVEAVTKMIPHAKKGDPGDADEETTVAPQGYELGFAALNDV